MSLELLSSIINFLDKRPISCRPKW
jgi:hypothetical protein